jgi:hypothetical protein
VTVPSLPSLPLPIMLPFFSSVPLLWTHLCLSVLLDPPSLQHVLSTECVPDTVLGIQP